MTWWSAVGTFLGLAAPKSEGPLGRWRPSLLGEGLMMKGEVTGEGDLHVAGHFEGTISICGTVVVEEGADVEAEVIASGVIIGGQIRGHLTVSGKVEILATGVLAGSIKTQSLMAADGASVRGEIWVERALQADVEAPEGQLGMRTT